MSAAEELLQRMRESDAPIPATCDLAAIYAQQLSVMAERLTPHELDRLVLLGGLIHRRTVRRVPVLAPSQIDAWLARR